MAWTRRRNVSVSVHSDDEVDEMESGVEMPLKSQTKRTFSRSPERHRAEIHGEGGVQPCQGRKRIYADLKGRRDAGILMKPSDYYLMGPDYSPDTGAGRKFNSNFLSDQRPKSSWDESPKKPNKKSASHKKMTDDDSAAMSSYRKFESRGGPNQSTRSRQDAPLEKSNKKKSFHDDTSDDDSVSTGKPGKKFRLVMGIHPDDITNKRLDDDDFTNDGTKKKDKVCEGPMSLNAQFRAIQPSPSILSFVEDNLLGRRRHLELRRAGYNIDLSIPLDNIPHSKSTGREPIIQPVFRNQMKLFASAKTTSSFPPPDLPEIAFGGRSNVGKSSLLNGLTRRWCVAETSDKPGLTQTIDFYKLGSKLCLVDLPGYGFAYAKEEVKDAWQELVKHYVSTRECLKRVCLLIDTKWGMKPRDHELIHLMDRSQTKYQIVLTKTDTVPPADVGRRAMQIEETLRGRKSAVKPLMMVSSKNGGGLQCLRTVLSKLARSPKVL